MLNLCKIFYSDKIYYEPPRTNDDQIIVAMNYHFELVGKIVEIIYFNNFTFSTKIEMESITTKIVLTMHSSISFLIRNSDQGILIKVIIQISLAYKEG